MTGEGIAAIIGASFSGVVSLATVILQFKQAGISRDTNTKVTAVHDQTTAIANATGSHKTLSDA